MLCMSFGDGEVQFEKSSQEFTSREWRDGETNLTALVCVKVVSQSEIRPAVAIEDYIIQLNVKVAQLQNVLVSAIGITQEIVSPG